MSNFTSTTVEFARYVITPVPGLNQKHIIQHDC